MVVPMEDLRMKSVTSVDSDMIEQLTGSAEFSTVLVNV